MQATLATPEVARPLSSKERPHQILLIDDSEDAMLLVDYALERFGECRYRLEWSRDLVSGLERLSRRGVDLVLLDLGLPESSGSTSYAWVRQTAAGVPVLVLTGDDSEETQDAVLASGAENFLVKDKVNPSRLMAAIRNTLEEARS